MTTAIEVKLRLNDEMRKRLDEYARAKGITRNAAMKILLDIGLRIEFERGRNGDS